MNGDYIIKSEDIKCVNYNPDEIELKWIEDLIKLSMDKKEELVKIKVE